MDENVVTGIKLLLWNGLCLYPPYATITAAFSAIGIAPDKHIASFGDSFATRTAKIKQFTSHLYILQIALIPYLALNAAVNAWILGWWLDAYNLAYAVGWLLMVLNDIRSVRDLKQLNHIMSVFDDDEYDPESYDPKS